MNNSLMSRRLTHREIAATLGITLGELARLRSKGSRQYDPTFPLPVGGLFIEAETLAWKKSKEVQIPTPPPSSTTHTFDRRNGVADRRRRAP